MRTPTRLALLITALIGLLPLAHGGKLSVQYNVDRRVIRVCNLCVPPNYTNLNPFLFMALQHSPLKPEGWEFDNPLAVPYVQDRPGTAVDVYDQWELGGHAPDAGSGAGYWAGRGMPPGSPVNKSWPQYWEVYFDGTTVERLRDYDLIYVSADAIDLHSSLRSALIDAVENGATLWVDSGGGYTTDVVRLMPPRVGAGGGGNYIPFSFVPQAPAPIFQRRTPLWNAERNSDLFRMPLVITDGERYALGDLPEPGTPGTPCDGSYISVPASPRPDQELVPILYTLDVGSGTSYPTIAVCQYGAGRIVVSANGVGDDVEEWMRQGRAAPDAYQAPDVKLAYNIAAWGTSWASGRQSSVNTGYTAASLLPPLDIAWQFPHADADPASLVIGSVVASPVVSHGRVFAVSLISDAFAAAPALLMCFDADPARDLDGDGDPDDAADLNGDGSPDPAFFDYRFGRPYDLVWARPLNALSGGGTSYATPRWAGVTACNLPDGTFAVLCSFVSQTGDSRNGFVAAVNGETGQNLWLFEATPFDAPAGGSNAQVRDISTPVVHRGWVYFTCSEFDPDLVPAAPLTAADATYGRAWCIDLQTGGGSVPPPPWFAEWGVWSFPDPGVQAERAGLLPPFAEPKWVAGMFPVENGIPGQPRQLPPDPGMLPAVTTHTRNATDRTEAVMVVGAPVSVRYSVGDDAIRLARDNLAEAFQQAGGPNHRRGGRDLALVPTPGRDMGGGTMEWFLNRNYYRLYLDQDVSAPADIAKITRHDDASFELTGGWILESPRVVVIDPDRARYLLAAFLGSSGTPDPTARVNGTNVDVTFNDPARDPQMAWLRGPVPWSTEYSREERRIAPGAIRNEKLFAVTTVPDMDETGTPPNPGQTARVVSQDLKIGAREWQFDPVTAAPGWLGVTAPQGRSKSAPAVGQDTVVTAMTLTPTAVDGHTVSGVFGTRTTPLLTVSLCSKPSVPDTYRIARGVPNPADAAPHNKPVTVGVWRGGGWVEVADWQYEVDYEEATVTFHWETAWNIRLVGGAAAGHIYGEPLRITWRWHNDNGTPDNTGDDVYGWSDTNLPAGSELYTVAPLMRFAYVPPCIKLRYYPVDVASIVIRTADGTPVSGWTLGEEPMYYDLDGDGTNEMLLPHGWVYLGPEDDNENGAIDDYEDRNGNGALDPGAFLDVNGNGVLDPGVDELLPPGIELEVSYSGFANEWGNVAVPNPALNIGWERHQAPVGFGASASATGMAGTSIHMGTEGYLGFDVDGDGRREFRTPPGATSANDTLLSLVWEPASNLVRGWMTAPAHLGNYRTDPLQIPAATGSPALAPDGLFVGSRVMDDESFGQSVGFVSRLGPRKTLVVDASRVVECSGQEVERELTGTQSWEYGQAAVDRPVQLALNHPSKVMSLGGGNLLIVDTGNNRVVETDSSGNVLWPLGEAYVPAAGDPPAPIVNWYSSPLNADLQLRRPSDAQRLTSVYDINGDGVVEQVVHTLIADTGNDRVLHVRSWWEWDAGDGRWEQRHRVQRVTPEYLPDPTDRTRRAKGHYTHVAAIPHPDPTFSNPATANTVGYMCAAPNLREIVVMGFYSLTAGGAVEFGLNPPADSYLPGGGAPLWLLWSWLYDDPTDAAVERDNPLLFAGLRHMDLQRLGDVVYLDVACGQYQGRLSKLTGGPAYASLVGPVAIEFRVSYAPGTLGLIPAAPGGTPDPDRPIWDFTQTDYNDPTGGAGPAYWSYFRLPLPNGTTYFKRFLPTCVKLLPTGQRLIVNNSGLIERLTKDALGRTGVVCSSEVLEVSTTWDDDDLPGNDVHDVDGRRLIPDPYGAEWRDPLVAPVYAERVVR